MKHAVLNAQFINPTEAVSVALPISKSWSNRAMAMCVLAGVPIPESYISDADDSRIMHACLTQDTGLWHTGLAGTTTRFLTALACIMPGTRDVVGAPRMNERPMHELISALRQLGAHITCLAQEGHTPLRIRGAELTGGVITVSGAVSSQFISALLLIGPYCKQGLTVQWQQKPVSYPYIALTVAMMQESGAAVRVLEHGIEVLPGRYNPMLLRPEADWSAAGYWYGWTALTGKPIIMPYLNAHSLQGDRQTAAIFEVFRVLTVFAADSIHIVKTKEEQPPCWTYDCTDIPDVSLILATTCAALRIPFELTGLQTLVHKETNRIEALRTEFNKLGIEAEVTDARILVRKYPDNLNTTQPICTYQDHRMAMAFSIFAAVAAQVTIEDMEVVGKSYPHFWDELRKLGVRISVF